MREILRSDCPHGAGESKLGLHPNPRGVGQSAPQMGRGTVASVLNHDEQWVLQVVRSLTDKEGGALASKRYLIVDRDTKYTDRFRKFIEDSGTEVIRLPPMSPNLNAYSERFVRSIKEECLGKMIFVGEASLRRAIREFISHYHEEPNHQGLDNTRIQAEPRATANDALIHRRQRLGGILNYYYRAAA
jgi:putative transposase